MNTRSTKTRWMGMLLMMLSLTWISCDTELQPTQVVSEQVLSFNVTIGNYQANIPQGSRVITTNYDSRFEDGDAFGLFVLESDSTITYQNMKVTLQNGAWIPERNITYLYTRKYFAYAPYREEYSDWNKYRTIGDVQKALAAFIPSKMQDTKDDYMANDLLVASNDLESELVEAASGGSLDLTFRHQMALLELSINDSEADFVRVSLNGGEPIKMFPSTVPKGTTSMPVYRCMVAPGTYTVDGTFFKDGVRSIIKATSNVKTEKGKYTRITVK